jgi:hypothetical protein
VIKVRAPPGLLGSEGVLEMRTPGKKLSLTGYSLLLILIMASCTPIVIDETGNASVGTIIINEIMARNNSVVVDSFYKNFCDWIELYNAGNEPIDLSTHFLTDNLNRKEKWPIPPGTVIEPGEYILFWADGMDFDNHTNFKLGGEGEEVGLYNSVGVLVDHMIFGAQVADVSYGRKQNDDSTLYYFALPTPGAANTTTAVRDKTPGPPVEFSIAAGFYVGSRVVELSAAGSNAQIRYTLDGSLPNEQSTLYSGPVQLDATAVLRVRTFVAGILPGPVTTGTYLIDDMPALPVVSISTDPANFFDPGIGIYVKGPNAHPEVPYYDANFWNNWERPVNVEFFEADGTRRLNAPGGVKVFGGDSVGNEQKSLALYARGRYGSEFFNYKFFNDKDIEQFKRIALRNSGQDWANTLFRDGMHQSLIMGQMDIDYQAYRPAVLILNGEYWGIHNIREKVDDDYVEANHKVAKDNIDYLFHFDGKVNVGRGDIEHYNAMLAFMEANDMTLPESYEYLKTQMDMNEYLNYQVAQMYWVNTAWLSENTKLWRPRVEGGKWRWMLFDTDFGFGLYESYHINMLEHSTATDGPSWPNPPWSTFLFRKLVENPQFRDDFVQRFAAHLNTTFLLERVLEIMDRVAGNIRTEMPATMDRWGGTLDEMMGFAFPSTLAEWDSNIEVMKKFALRRPVYARQHLIDFFGLSGTFRLTIHTYPSQAGKVLINNVPIPPGRFSGLFFKDVPLALTVAPNEGYRFVRWQGGSGLNPVSTVTSVTLNEDTRIDVIFTEKGK